MFDTVNNQSPYAHMGHSIPNRLPQGNFPNNGNPMIRQPIIDFGNHQMPEPMPEPIPEFRTAEEYNDARAQYEQMQLSNDINRFQKNLDNEREIANQFQACADSNVQATQGYANSLSQTRQGFVQSANAQAAQQMQQQQMQQQQMLQSPCDPCGQQFGSPYGQQFGSPYGQQFGSPYGQQFGNPYAQQFGSPYGQQFGNPYAQQFGSPYGQQFGNPYAQQFGSPYTQQQQYYQPSQPFMPSMGRDTRIF